MSSKDAKNSMKGYMGLMETGPSCSGAILLPANSPPARSLPWPHLRDVRLLGNTRKPTKSFLQNNSDAYLALDKKCEELTLAERKIGAFEQLRR